MMMAGRGGGREYWSLFGAATWDAHQPTALHDVTEPDLACEGS
jgi:hypothetical protein